MLIINQFDPPWQTANIFVLLNAFETFCFPLCITGIVFFLYNALNRIVLNQIKSHCIVRSHRIGSCFICIFNVSYRWLCIEMRIASASVMEMHIPTKWINKLILMIFKNLKRNLLKTILWSEKKVREILRKKIRLLRLNASTETHPGRSLITWQTQAAHSAFIFLHFLPNYIAKIIAPLIKHRKPHSALYGDYVSCCCLTHLYVLSVLSPLHLKLEKHQVISL